MVVVDASAFVDALLYDVPVLAISESELHAPTLIDYEMLSSARRFARADPVRLRWAEYALERFANLSIQRHPAQRLLRRAWELRENLCMYDAAYVSLAMSLGVPLLTHDLRLARAASLHCEVLTG